MSSDMEYDLVTIGAGSGGVRASRVSAGVYGAKVCSLLLVTCCLLGVLQQVTSSGNR